MPAHTWIPSRVPPWKDVGRRTRAAALELAGLSEGARNEAVEAIAVALEESAAEIPCRQPGRPRGRRSRRDISPSLYARLKLDEVKLRGEIAGVRDVGRLPDPVGARQIGRRLDDGLVLERISVPVGVLGVIFEARPDAVIQTQALR